MYLIYGRSKICKVVVLCPHGRLTMPICTRYKWVLGDVILGSTL